MINLLSVERTKPLGREASRYDPPNKNGRPGLARVPDSCLVGMPPAAENKKCPDSTFITSPSIALINGGLNFGKRNRIKVVHMMFSDFQRHTLEGCQRIHEESTAGLTWGGAVK